MAKKQEKEVVEKQERIWTDAEMHTMDREVEAFKTDKGMNWNKWYESKGVARIRIVEHTKWPSGEKTGETSEQLIILRDELDQIPFTEEEKKVAFYQNWKGRKSFGESKKVEHLEQLAQQMRVGNDII